MGLVDKIFEHEREGYYGEYGGAFIPEILRTTLDELIDVFHTCLLYTTPSTRDATLSRKPS